MDRPRLLNKVYDYKRYREALPEGLYPFFRPISVSRGTEVVVRGKPMLMFGSNSYLGLDHHPEVLAAMAEASRRYGSGCGGSRFLNGTLDLHLELERELADLVKKPAALLYSTGFQANLGAIDALAGPDDAVLMDSEDHASILDGARLSRARLARYRHNDLDSLERHFAVYPPETGVLVVVDGVFSMSGRVARLPEICARCSRSQAVLMVDEAHALGVLGPEGSGSARHFGVSDQVHLIMGTFSKSLASQGGFIASDEDTIDYLKHHSRTLIFSASLSPSNTAAALTALRILRREPGRVARLWENVDRMKAGLRGAGFDLGDTESPILPVYCRSTLAAIRLALRLQEEGVFVNPIVSPAVAPRDEMIRLSVTAEHSAAQVDTAVERIARVGEALGLLDSHAGGGSCE